jgi:predicted unusual protein kinase regulating ubiquinone biosynthesis (AarF/ABC1/UbiB family)
MYQNPMLRHANTLRSVVELSSRLCILKQDGGTVGRWLCNRLPVLGPTYVKIGQYIASRADIFGSDMARELACLRDCVPPEPVENFRHILPPDLHVDETPIASASIGQVHRASLGDQRVVVKIRRTGIRDIVREDTRLLKLILRMFEHSVKSTRESREQFLDLHRSLDAFWVGIDNEMDFVAELQNIETFTMKYYNRMHELRIPSVIPSYSSECILVMEDVPSQNILKYAKSLDSNNDRQQLAVDLMTTFLSQLLDGGVIHGDPHLGNMGIDDDNRLVLYDFGSIIQIPKEDRCHLKNILIMLIVGDLDSVMNSLKDLRVVIRDPARLRAYVNTYRQYMQTLDVGVFSEELSKERHDMVAPLQFTEELVRLFRVYTILEGTCRLIDPAFNYFDFFRKYIPAPDDAFLHYKATVDIKIILKRFSSEIDRFV